MIKLFYLISIILYLNNYFEFVFSTNPNDASCLKGLLSNAGQTSNYPLTGVDTYCENYYGTFNCDGSNYIEKIYFPDSFNYQFRPSDFSCFTNPVQFYMNGGYITPTFFDNPSTLNLASFEITGTDLVYSRTFLFSEIVKFSSFNFEGANLNLSFTNDLLPNDSYYMYEISVISNNIPTFNNVLIQNIKFFLSKSFDINTFSNIKNVQTYSFVLSGYYAGGRLFNYPMELLNRSSIPISSFLLTEYLNFSKPTVPLDFSNQSVEKLSFNELPISFLDDGKIPISKLNPLTKTFRYDRSSVTDVSNLEIVFSNTENIVIFYGRINTTMDRFLPIVNGKVKSLDVGLNLITGTLNERFCNLPKLSINGNKLSGTLPSCYTCHLGRPDFQNSDLNPELNAGFSNYVNPPPCTTIIPNLKFDFVANKTWLFGQDLGFDNSAGYYFTSTPIAKWIMDVPSKSFYKMGTETSSFDIFYRFPRLTFTVTASPKQPIIDSVYVSVNGKLIINGTNFNYNTSLIEVNINGLKQCLITNATFYQIFCTLDSSEFENSQFVIDSPSVIKIESIQTSIQITVISDFLNKYLNCSSPCTDKSSVCSRNLGICITQHYISSIEPTTLEGGNVVLHGNLTDEHQYLIILIGSYECKVISVNETTIICNLPKMNSQDTLLTTKVYQNGLQWVKEKSYEPLDIDQSCPNDCTSPSNGKCDTKTGQCNCINQYRGFDCSGIFIEGTTSSPNIDNGKGSVSITNQETSFDVLITNLVEIDYNGNQILNYVLNGNWKLVNSSNLVSIFSQNVGNEGCTITLILEIIENGKNINFAGIDFLLDSGSIKITIQIENYNYQSNLNTLQIQMKSALLTNENNQETDNCNLNKDTEIKSQNDYSSSSAIEYISIKRNGKIFFGRLINRAISDGKSTLITSSLISKDSDSIIVGLNLPTHAVNCLIDPDMQVLLSTDFKDSCDSNNKPYIIPLAVVLPVAGVATIFAISFYLIKKRKMKIQMDGLKLKIKSHNNIN